jgi:hypothetical protein
MRTLACLAVLSGGILVAALHAGALPGIDPQTNKVPGEPTIYVLNDSMLGDDLVRATLAVFQAALDRDFAPAWNEDAVLQFAAKGDRIPPGAWQILLANQTDTGSLGYHWTAHGAPIARVFVASAIEARDSWEKMFSHELFEMLIDPHVSWAAWDGSRKIRLVEVCDPVEGLDYAFHRRDSLGRTVQVSDFVLPSWFKAGSTPPYDFTRHVHHPGQLLADGFVNVWGHGSWQEISGP